MATIQQIKCDVCGKIKGEVNHWFKFHVSSGVFRIASADDAPAGDANDGCSEPCVIKALSAWIADQRGASLKITSTAIDVTRLVSELGHAPYYPYVADR